MKRRRGSWEVIEVLGPVVLENVEGCIVEIGAGWSTHIFCDLARIFERKFYCCDSNWRKIDAVELMECGDNLNVFKGYSLDFIKDFDDDIALILIDGEHKYVTVEQEVNFFLPRLVVGGIMFLHDTLPPKPKTIYNKQAGDVYLARQELERREGLDVFTWPYTARHYGLTMVMKKEENAPWFRR